jgi:hypothetical protein
MDFTIFAPPCDAQRECATFHKRKERLIKLLTVR